MIPPAISAFFSYLSPNTFPIFTPNIEIINEEVENIENDCITIIATGPLTSDKLSEQISKLTASPRIL